MAKVTLKTYRSEKKARRVAMHLASTTKKNIVQFGKRVVTFRVKA